MICPECGSDSICGHEIQGVYDGVLFWSCFACGIAFARDWGKWDNMQRTSNLYVREYNEERMASGR